jgi:hypothetical protein
VETLSSKALFGLTLAGWFLLLGPQGVTFLPVLSSRSQASPTGAQGLTLFVDREFHVSPELISFHQAALPPVCTKYRPDH